MTEKNAIVVEGNLHTKEVYHRSKVFKGEVLREMINESLYSLCVIPRFFDVIDIDKNIKDGATIVEDE